MTPPYAACCLQVSWTPTLSIAFGSLNYVWKAQFKRLLYFREGIGLLYTYFCIVVEKAGVNQVWLSLFYSKHSCNTFLGISNLSATLKRKLEQKKSVPKEIIIKCASLKAQEKLDNIKV